MLLVLAFVAIFLAAYGLQLRRENLVVKYRFRFYALRDKLRWLVAEDDQIARQWVFDYFDSSLSRATVILPDLSFWELIFLYNKHRNDESLTALRQQLEDQLSRPEHVKLKEIEVEYIGLLAAYFFERSVVLVGLGNLVYGIFLMIQMLRWTRIKQVLIDMKAWLSHRGNRFVELVIISPETSTLAECAPGR